MEAAKSFFLLDSLISMQIRRQKIILSQIGAALLVIGAVGAALSARRAAGAMAAQKVAAKPGVAYDVTPRFGKAPGVSVAMRFAISPEAEVVDVQMPVWSPGDYHVQNFAKYIQSFRAWDGAPDDAHPLSVSRTDGNTWRIVGNGAKFLTLTYTLPQMPPGLFSENVQVNSRQIFLNGPAVCMYPVGRKNEPAELTFHLPQNWQAECPLPRAKPCGGTNRRFHGAGLRHANRLAVACRPEGRNANSGLYAEWETAPRRFLR